MKASSRQKQLNIRSDEAYETARALSHRLKLPTQEVVLRALRKLATETGVETGELPPELTTENLARLRDARREAWGGKRPPVGLTSEHDWLYDENGLPK
ncbi:type II toxin-antitoxin system VapB family antitoxin [Terrarubrum flagellatum]|uniref:type II toxin-antitoxin system VapB family antitoxin n=1 Tax=Terrirubrum flagellatum TaxID=2895980 RepID=UPI0031455597